MDFFATYYKAKFVGVKFIDFKKLKEHPTQIIDILNDVIGSKRAQKFINNQRSSKET
jgi:hypothetical protein